MILLSKALEEAIRKHGEEGYPHEICGFIIGDAAREGEKAASRLIPILNESAGEEAGYRFYMPPEAYVEAEKNAMATGEDIIGIYHSHPDWPEKPSEYDYEHSLPFYSYIIVSVQNGQATGFASWELNKDRSKFSEEAIARPV